MSNYWFPTARTTKEETAFVRDELERSTSELLSGALRIITDKKREGKYFASLHYFSIRAVQEVSGILITKGYEVKLKSDNDSQYELIVGWEDPVEV
ncbi:hypothetical protein DKZ34_03995 [Limosilactobacillus reuteri]|uniref:hypothetical protein n=1 Tax=Limosilactobacillus reuteri TaxID=1598 RepID=UPI000D6EEEAE|nr:hypothetical protein [Limosilactobacillus reuteri]PWT41017.1 hypothetical protein DKZ34_03995 [Limosilactobacillus reuteri]